MRQHHRLRPRFQALALRLIALWPLAAAPLAAQSHHFVYLSAATASTISGFELNSALGTLTEIAGSPFNQTPDPGTMTVHPSGRFLYAMNAGAKNVSAFAVNPITGVLAAAPASPFAVGAFGYTPKLFLVESSGRFLYVVSTIEDPLGTATSVSYYTVDQVTGGINPTPAGTFSLGFFAPAGLVFRPGDKFLYLAGTANPASGSAVSIFTIELDPATGVFVDASPLGGQGQFARSLAISPDGQFLFVGRGQLLGSIDTYTISTDGIPQYSNNTFPIPGPQALPYALAVDASGSYLYGIVAGLGILGFSLNPASGALISLQGSPFVGPPVSPSSVLLADPLEPFLYFEARPFAISAANLAQGALDELAASPLLVGGTVTGIAAANPLDPVQPITTPLAALAPLILQFSDQNVGAVSQPQQVALSNTGTAPLILSGISLTGPHAPEFELSTGDCLAVLLPGNGCTLVIKFQPASDGVRQATLTVVDNAIGSPHTVALTGAGRLPFTIQLDSSTGTVTAGQMAQYNLRLVPAVGFVGQVLLACSGAPAQSACDVPVSLQLNGVTPAPFSVRVPTTARSVVSPLARPSHPGFGTGYSLRLLAWGTVLTMLFLMLFRMRPAPAVLGPPFRIHCAVLLLLVWASLSLVSCAATSGGDTSSSTGGTAPTATSSTSPSAATGTPAGLYALTLTAASGSAAQTFQLSLAVQ